MPGGIKEKHEAPQDCPCSGRHSNPEPPKCTSEQLTVFTNLLGKTSCKFTHTHTHTHCKQLANYWTISHEDGTVNAAKYNKFISKVVNLRCTSALSTESQHVSSFVFINAGTFCPKPPVVNHTNLVTSSADTLGRTAHSAYYKLLAALPIVVV